MRAKKTHNPFTWDCQCRICGVSFYSSRYDALTCSAQCRKKLSRNRGHSMLNRRPPLRVPWSEAAELQRKAGLA